MGWLLDIGIIGIALFPFTKVIGIRVVVIRTNRSVVVVVVRRSSVVVVVCRIRSRSRSRSRIIRSIHSNRSIRSSICISSCSIPSIRVGIGVGNAIVPEHGTFGPDRNVLDTPHHVGIFFGPNVRVLTETQRRRPVRVIVVVRLVSVGGFDCGPSRQRTDEILPGRLRSLPCGVPGYPSGTRSTESVAIW